MFPNKCIGRRGTVQFPARSPDLTLIDSFLCPTVKHQIYRATAVTLENMKKSTEKAFQNVRPLVSNNARRSFRNRLLK